MLMWCIQYTITAYINTSNVVMLHGPKMDRVAGPQARIEILHPFASHSHVETNQSRQVHGKALVIVNENVKLKAFLYNLLPRTGHLRER